MSDYKGAALLVETLPPSRDLLTDRGYDSDGFRAALRARDITSCIRARKHRKVAIAYGAMLCR